MTSIRCTCACVFFQPIVHGMFCKYRPIFYEGDDDLISVNPSDVDLMPGRRKLTILSEQSVSFLLQIERLECVMLFAELLREV